MKLTFDFFFNSQGSLKGFDQHMNMIMEECHERVYSSDAGVDQVVLGLYIVRGDNMYVSLSLSLPSPTQKKLSCTVLSWVNSTRNSTESLI